jgi:hypothetical protein
MYVSGAKTGWPTCHTCTHPGQPPAAAVPRIAAWQPPPGFPLPQLLTFGLGRGGSSWGAGTTEGVNSAMLARGKGMPPCATTRLHT